MLFRSPGTADVGIPPRHRPGEHEVDLRGAVPAAEMEQHNPALLGGDISLGRVTMARMIARPTPLPDPYRLGGTGWYLCSSATPPGPGVHGMSGWHAARRVLRREFGIRTMPDLAPALPADPTI